MGAFKSAASEARPPVWSDPLEIYNRHLAVRNAQDRGEQLRLQNERLRAETAEVAPTAAARREEIAARQRREESQESVNLQTLKTRELEAAIKRGNRLAELASTAVDQASYDRAIASAVREGTLAKEVLGQIPRQFSPDVIDQFRRQALGYKGQAELELKERREKRLTSNAAAVEEERRSTREWNNISRVLGSANTPGKWESGINALRKMGVREATIERLPEYSEDTVAQLRSLGMSAGEQSRAELSERRLETAGRSRGGASSASTRAEAQNKAYTTLAGKISEDLETVHSGKNVQPGDVVDWYVSQFGPDLAEHGVDVPKLRRDLVQRFNSRLQAPSRTAPSPSRGSGWSRQGQR